MKPKGYKYKDKTATSYGLTSIKLKAGVVGKSQVQVRGAGVGLAMPTLGLSSPVVVQLVISDAAGSSCFENTFVSASKNASTAFENGNAFTRR